MATVARFSNKNTSCSVKFEFQINSHFLVLVCPKYHMGHSYTNYKYCMGYTCTSYNYYMGHVTLKKVTHCLSLIQI